MWCQINSYKPSVFLYLGLASAVWMIYTTDKLIDSGAVQPTQRDSHFKKNGLYYKIVLLVAGAIAIISGIVIGFNLLIKLSPLLVLSLFYLFMIFFIQKKKNKYFGKEFFTATIYGLAIVLGANTQIIGSTLWVVVGYCLIVFASTALTAHLDKASDMVAGRKSLPIVLNKWFGVVWLSSVFLSMFMLGIGANQKLLLTLYFILFTHLFLFFTAKWSFTQNHHRTIAELTFIAQWPLYQILMI